MIELEGLGEIKQEYSEIKINRVDESIVFVRIPSHKTIDFLKELDDPHLINTYEKIINQSKERLHKVIDDPTYFIELTTIDVGKSKYIVKIEKILLK